jgi:hypothetical protein
VSHKENTGYLRLLKNGLFSKIMTNPQLFPVNTIEIRRKIANRIIEVERYIC